MARRQAIEIDLKTQICYLATEILGWIIILYGLFFTSEIFLSTQEGITSPQLYLPCIFGISLIICGVGLINRHNWARIMTIILTLLSVPIYIYTAAEDISKNIISLIVYSLVCLGMVLFLFYSRVKEQFRR